MASPYHGHGAQALTHQPYLQARLLRCLANDSSDSCVDVTIVCHERATQQRLWTGIDAKLLASDYDIEPAHSQHRIQTAVQLQQILDLTAEVTYFISIRQANSQSSLSINHALLASLIEHCHLSSKLYDFLAFLGPRHGESSLSPPLMWVEFDSPDVQETQSVCAYILRLPESHGRVESNPWAIRPCLVYLQSSGPSRPSFVLSTGTALSIQQCLSNHIVARGLTSSPSCHLHQELLHIAVSAWRPYISYLSERVDDQSDLAVSVDLNEDGLDQATLETRQFLKRLDDTLAETVLNINHAITTVRALQQHCSTILRPPSGRKTDTVKSQNEHTQCTQWFDYAANSLRHYLEQLAALRYKVQSTSNLVSNILDLNNSNQLRLLAIRAADEGAIMQELTKKATQDATAVKVLTILTLIYLPSTVVMNFFSTSFVSTTKAESGRTILMVASNWWIAIAATVPLTIITLYAWWFYVQKELRGEWPVTWKTCVRMVNELKLYVKNVRHRTQPTARQPSWDMSSLEVRTLREAT